MKASKIIVVQEYNIETENNKTTFLVDAESAKLVDEWIIKNKQNIRIAEEGMGSVRPNLTIYITENGDIIDSSTQVISIYNEIDSKGTIAVPQQKIDELIRIVRNYGQERI